MRETAARLDIDLAGVPRCFGHGDFFAENLLVEGGRLRAWSIGTPPVRDASARSTCSTCWSRRAGGAWSSPGGRRCSASCCPGHGAAGKTSCVATAGGWGRPDAALLERLATAYWLERAAAQLSTHAERWEDREWIEANVAAVARAGPPPVGE